MKKKDPMSVLTVHSWSFYSLYDFYVIKIQKLQEDVSDVALIMSKPWVGTGTDNLKLAWRQLLPHKHLQGELNKDSPTARMKYLLLLRDDSLRHCFLT